MNSFQVRRFQLSLDTGDHVLNAWLYPVNFISVLRHRIRINFNGENYLAVTVRNRPLRMLYAWIKN